MFSCDLGNGAEMRLRTLSDADESFDVIEANRAYLEPWFSWVEKVRTVEDTHEHILRGSSDFFADGPFNAGLFLNGRYVGNAGFHNHDKPNRKIEMGYWLAEHAQGNGIVTRAVSVLITHGFRQMNLHRVAISAAPENLRSRAIPQRLGFTEEGLHRSASWTCRGWKDLVVYGLLENEWRP